MSHKKNLKQTSFLIAGIILLSTSCIRSEEQVMKAHSNVFDVRDKNIGFVNSPNAISTTNPSTVIPNCLASQAVIGATTTVYRNAVAQASIAVNPLNKHEVVAVFSQDVVGNNIFSTEGGLSIGIAYSEDGGKNWIQTTSLNTQYCSGGFADTVSDAWVSYGVNIDNNPIVYLTAEVFNTNYNINNRNQSGIITAYSVDNGQTWSNPQFLDANETYLNYSDINSLVLDKPSITADPNVKDFAYAVWSRLSEIGSLHSDAITSRTDTGGMVWAQNYTLYDPSLDATFGTINNGIYNNMSVNNNIIVVTPNGDLLNFMTRTYAAPGTTDMEFTNDVWPYQYRLFDIAFVRSTDNGITWDTDATVVTTIDGNSTFTGGYTYDISGNITGGVGAQTSTEGSNQFFNVGVNQNNGNLYVVWQSGQFTSSQLPQIAIIASRDGGSTWSAPVRINQTPLDAPNPQAFTPAVAITQQGVVGVLYHDFRRDDNAVPTTNTSTKTNVWFAQYKEDRDANGGGTGIGLHFTRESRVSKRSYIMQQGPSVNPSTQLLTNGDYNSVVALGDDFFAAYVKANDYALAPVQTLVDTVIDELTTVLLLDNNKRTSPFFSKIDEKQHRD